MELLLGQGYWSFPALWFSFAGSCFLSLGSGFGLPGLIAIFFLHLDMFLLVSTYKVKGVLSLKSKVCWTGSGSAAFRLRWLAGACLPRFPPTLRSGCLS